MTNLEADQVSEDEIRSIMENLREFPEDILPGLPPGVDREQWRRFFRCQVNLARYFDGLSCADAEKRALEACVNKWQAVTAEAYAPPQRELCAACGAPIEDNLATLSDGATVHYGGHWELDCWRMYLEMCAREREEAAAALRQRGIP